MPKEPARTDSEPTKEEIDSLSRQIKKQLSSLKDASTYYDVLNQMRNIISRFDFALKQKRRVIAKARYHDPSTGVKRRYSLNFNRWFQKPENKEKVRARMREVNRAKKLQTRVKNTNDNTSTRL